jgi:hypothetical protein
MGKEFLVQFVYSHRFFKVTKYVVIFSNNLRGNYLISIEQKYLISSGHSVTTSDRLQLPTIYSGYLDGNSQLLFSIAETIVGNFCKKSFNPKMKQKKKSFKFNPLTVYNFERKKF